MDSSFHNQKSQNLKLSSSHKHSKKRLTQEKVKVLENSFTGNKKLEPELKPQLANQLCLPPRQIAVSYQNKRARWKTQTLEVGYSAPQLKLENALADKQRLEREVKLPRDELKKSRDQLSTFMNQRDNCYYYDSRYYSNDGQVLRFDDELYACLIDNNNAADGSSPSCFFD